MKDNKFDKIIKSKINEELDIPDNINSLFSNFERRIIMEKKEKIKGGIFKYAISIIASLIILTGGGLVFAHTNGVETIISPLLRNMGINSKYEQEKTEINESVNYKNVKIDILDVGFDHSSLIVGYKIDINNNNLDNWIDIYGQYKLNNLLISPISQSIDKDNEETYIMYQLFDTSEIDLKDKNVVNLSIDISKIDTYTEYEDLVGAYKNYNNSIEGNWSFNKDITITNNQKTIKYTFNTNSVEILNNVYVSINNLISGAYTNILTIHTDKKNYKSDSFEVYYKVFDENNKEIVMGCESRDYDETVYNERLVLGDISLNQKITLKIYVNSTRMNSRYNELGKITLDLSKKSIAKEGNIETTVYTGNEYFFKYDKSWKILGIATKESVGPLNRRVGSLQIEIPNTSNSEYPSHISILTHKNVSLNNFIKDLKNQYLSSSEEGGFILKEEGDYNVNMRGYKLVFELAGNAEIVAYLLEYNGTTYEIEFTGTDIEYNNLQNEIENVVKSFTVLNN